MDNDNCTIVFILMSAITIMLSGTGTGMMAPSRWFSFTSMSIVSVSVSASAGQTKEFISKEIIKSLFFIGDRATPILVKDDFQDEKATSDSVEIQNLLNPEELMKKIISKMKLKELKNFLNFVIGSNSLPEEKFRISFNVFDASSESFRSQVGSNNSFALAIRGRSAQATFEALLESIRYAAGINLDTDDENI